MGVGQTDNKSAQHIFDSEYRGYFILKSKKCLTSVCFQSQDFENSTGSGMLADFHAAEKDTCLLKLDFVSVWKPDVQVKPAKTKGTGKEDWGG